MGERGSVGILFVAVLFVLAALSACVMLYVGRALDYGRRVEAREALRLRLYAAVRGTIDELAADATPESDGPRDRVWSTLGELEGGVSLGLSDLSSRLNANYTPAELLEKTELRSLLSPSASPEALAAYREEKGLSTELGHYAGLLREDALDSWSCFGWANVNVADLSSLRALYRSLTGNEDGASAFSLQVGAARSAKRLVAAGSLEAFLGSSYPELYPVICAEAPYNANFSSAFLIRAILSFPRFGIPDPAARAEAVIAAREDHDLSEPELAVLLGASSGGEALQYLGVRTWFWIVRAEAEGHAYSAIVAAWPRATSGEGAKSRRLAVVQASFDP